MPYGPLMPKASHGLAEVVKHGIAAPERKLLHASDDEGRGRTMLPPLRQNAGGKCQTQDLQALQRNIRNPFN